MITKGGSDDEFKLVEVAGTAPASRDTTSGTSTCVVNRFILAQARWVDDHAIAHITPIWFRVQGGLMKPLHTTRYVAAHLTSGSQVHRAALSGSECGHGLTAEGTADDVVLGSSTSVGV